MTGRLLLTAVMLACACSLARAAAELPEPGKQVVTRRMIQEAGLTRLADVLALAEGWDAVTVEGFAWSAAPPGLGLYAAPGWTLFLDGERIDLDEMGVRSLNRLPLTLDQVERVEFARVPVISGGELAQAGSIHIHTVRPDRGSQVGGRVVTGSETGDPGPFRYTRHRVPNVERFGHEATVTAAHRGERFHGGLRFVDGRHYAGDPAVIDRFEIQATEGRVMDLNALALVLGWRSPGSAHEISAGRSRLDDGFLLGAYGSEILADNAYDDARIRGEWPLGNEAKLGYRLSRTANALEERESRLDLDFDWKRTSTRGEIELEAAHRGIAAVLGVGAERISLRTGYALDEDAVTLVRGHASLERAAGARIRYQGAAQVLAGAGEVGVKALGRTRWRTGDDHLVVLALGFSRRPPAEDGRVWFWRERGYRFLEDAGIDVRGEPALQSSRRWSADLAWRGRVGGGLDLEAAGFLHGSSDELLETRRFRYLSALRPMDSPVDLIEGAEGTVIGGSLRAARDLAPGLRASVFYRYQDPVNGDRAFREAYATRPRHRLRAAARLEPVPGLVFSGLLRYWSATRWVDYRGLGGIAAAGGRLGNMTALDLSAQKWFWKRRVRGTLTFRNVLDREIRLHPAGGVSRLGLVAQVSVRFGSG